METECTKWRDFCPPGEEEVAGFAPSSTQNRVCLPCASGFWRAGPTKNDLVDQTPSCQRHEVAECGLGFVEAVAASRSNERVCEETTVTTTTRSFDAPKTDDSGEEVTTTTIPTTSTRIPQYGFPDANASNAAASSGFGQRQIVMIVLVIVVAVLCIAIVGSLKKRKSADHIIAPIEHVMQHRAMAQSANINLMMDDYEEESWAGTPQVGSRTHFDTFNNTIQGLESHAAAQRKVPKATKGNSDV